MKPKASADALWIADLGDGRYRNPIIHSDFSDPDVIRYNDDFYLTASSFNSVPGLPILHSTDLVNWKLVNYALQRLDWPGYEVPALGKGVWAPSLRVHDGYFFIYFASPDDGIFMVRTKDPLGEWQAPVCVKKAVGWIDPCPFWDDDGRAYLVVAFAASRIGFKSVLRLNRMSPDGTQVLPEGRFIYDGQTRHQTLEGPKMYKRNGWYYIFAPAGGVQFGWQTVLRSRDPWGPYEDRIVLHQGNSPINGPHQGGWVDTGTGEDWFLHFQDRGAYGRIVHLQPMEWNFDWPRIGVDTNNDGIGEPVLTYKKPNCRIAPVESFGLESGDDFSGLSLSPAWQWQADPRPGFSDLDSSNKTLRLFAFPATTFPATLATAAHILTQKFPAPAFRARVQVSPKALAQGFFAGLLVLGKKSYGIGLRWTENLGVFEILDDGRSKIERLVTSVAVSEEGVTLGLEVYPGGKGRFFLSEPGSARVFYGTSFVAEPGVWVGAKVGLCCLADEPQNQGWADFKNFEIKPLEYEACPWE